LTLIFFCVFNEGVAFSHSVGVWGGCPWFPGVPRLFAFFRALRVSQPCSGLTAVAGMARRAGGLRPSLPPWTPHATRLCAIPLRIGRQNIVLTCGNTIFYGALGGAASIGGSWWTNPCCGWPSPGQPIGWPGVATRRAQSMVALARPWIPCHLPRCFFLALDFYYLCCIPCLVHSIGQTRQQNTRKN
jgi:hypothetical protein